MPRIDIVRECKIIKTPRLSQLEGIFDIPPSERSAEAWEVDLPIEERAWNIGLIVGPSGCGKSTIIKEMFKNNIQGKFRWPKEKSVVDGFPKSMGIKDIVKILNSVGFSSPPSWVRPFRVLSNGEQFRVNVARALAESNDLCVMDEFTSVVDRTVGQLGSFAVAKTVRKLGKKFIAASCHYDIEEWLQPDWIYKPHENEFQWRFLQQRPSIDLEIIKVHHKAWEIFKQHHYLSLTQNKAAQCFVAFWNDIPVAFYSYLHFVNNRLKRTKRGHRVVCLPDFQGIGIGMQLEEFIASCLKTLNWDYIGASSHPARQAYCLKSENWTMIREPTISGNRGRKGIHQINLGRMLSTFRYVGPKVARDQAEGLINA